MSQIVWFVWQYYHILCSRINLFFSFSLYFNIFPYFLEMQAFQICNTALEEHHERIQLQIIIECGFAKIKKKCMKMKVLAKKFNFSNGHVYAATKM